MAFASKLAPKTDLVVEHRLATRDYQRLASKVTRLKRELTQTEAAKRLAKRFLGKIEAALRCDLNLGPGEWLCERCGVTRLSKKQPICQPCQEDGKEN